MEYLLEVNNVSKTYPKFRLKDVSFEVPSGSIVGFIGRNGAGKTTTLKGIMNLVHFDCGCVKVFDKEIKENELEAKQNIGFSLSELSYYPNKKIKDIMAVTKKFYKNFSQDKFDKLCQMFNLDINKRLEQLSSGMKVKYSLAIALSYGAKLLILDEPTSGLDPISRDEILEIFQNIIKDNDRGILFSTHITSDLDKCATHIVYIHEGEIVYKGTKKDFINQYRTISGSLDIYSDSLLEHAISIRKHIDNFEGLIKKDYIKEYEKVKGLTIKESDLEEVMVYLERGKGNEEFTL